MRQASPKMKEIGVGKDFTFRPRIMTWCFPRRTIASTKVRPMPPVPPATATMAILSRDSWYRRNTGEKNEGLTQGVLISECGTEE